MKKEKEVKTTPIDHMELAAVLMTQGYKLIELDRHNPARINFLFKDSDEIYTLINQYFNSELKVDPKLLLSNMRALKNIIRNNYNKKDALYSTMA